MKFIKALLISMALAIATAAHAQTNLIFGGAFPASNPDSRAMTAFAKRIAEQSGGDLTFDMAFGGQMLDFRSALTSIESDLVDAGQIYPAFFLSELKVMNTFTDMGLAASESWAHTAAVLETVLLDCPACTEEFARYNLKLLALSGSAPFQLICRSPIKTIADLTGQSVRAVSANQGFMNAIGANPVGIVPSEVFEAMQRGQVECAFAPLDWITAYGLADVAEYIVDTPLTHDSSRMPLVMNLDVWESLSGKNQQLIIRNLPFLSAQATANNIAEGEAARRLAEKKGLDFGSGGEAYVEQLAKYRAKELDRVVRDAKARGVESADQIVAAYRENHERWLRIVKKTNGDRAAYENALWHEIYSHVQ